MDNCYEERPMSALLEISVDRINHGGHGGRGEDWEKSISQIPRDPRDPRGPTSAEIAISLRGLRKTYGALEAVRGVDLEIQRGEIFGVIGPDGAGKTSIFQILGGVMQATAGEAILFGQTAREARSSIGYLTQTFSLYQDLSVSENLRYMGELRKLPMAEVERRGMHYLKLFDMDRFTDRLAGKLSGGMKQKLALACALITEPQVLLLDEPTTGVDPVSRREFWDTLAQLSADGMTIVVATPYLD
jgi:ABC-2 type transport system ATP-binding protein